jgi:hypothetical protein
MGLSAGEAASLKLRSGNSPPPKLRWWGGVARAALTALLTGAVTACVAGSGDGGSGAGVYPFSDLSSVAGTSEADRARSDYPEVFRGVDDPVRPGELDVRGLRRDLSRVPVDDRNYRALYAVAVAFFELHERAERDRGGGLYFAYSFQATKMMAIPWGLYAEIPERGLRASILDFYEDVLFGEKPGLEAVRGRYTRVVADLSRKETDPELRARIARIVARARELTPDAG